jgi:hypothetical protein
VVTRDAVATPDPVRDVLGRVGLDEEGIEGKVFRDRRTLRRGVRSTFVPFVYRELRAGRRLGGEPGGAARRGQASRAELFEQDQRKAAEREAAERAHEEYERAKREEAQRLDAARRAAEATDNSRVEQEACAEARRNVGSSREKRSVILQCGKFGL